MLNIWLDSNERNPCPYSHFKVIDLREKILLSSGIKSHLRDLYVSARFDLHFLESLKGSAASLGWEWNKVRKSIVEKGIPTISNFKRGEFGEVLITAVLEQFHDYKIPVYKLRYKITANQSLPGTDIVALGINNEGTIIEVCFVETKLRTRKDNMAAIDGYKQLKETYESKLPDILTFIAARLQERKDNLYKAYMFYLLDRTDNRGKDNFRLGLCWENSEWSENVLENLQDNGVDLPKLILHVIPINNLRQITDELFADLGVKEVSDDD